MSKWRKMYMVLTFGGHITSVLGLKHVHLLILVISLRVMIFFMCRGRIGIYFVFHVKFRVFKGLLVVICVISWVLPLVEQESMAISTFVIFIFWLIEIEYFGYWRHVFPCFILLSFPFFLWLSSSVTVHVHCSLPSVRLLSSLQLFTSL